MMLLGCGILVYWSRGFEEEEEELQGREVGVDWWVR